MQERSKHFKFYMGIDKPGSHKPKQKNAIGKIYLRLLFVAALLLGSCALLYYIILFFTNQ